jgi:arylsulfatase A-like enzyme
MAAFDTEAPAPRKSSDSVKPNFVFILADDLGWNSLGYLNYDLNFTTPTLTSLAQQGIIMGSYYAQEVCTPSRAALLTGRYPLSIGTLRDDLRTMICRRVTSTFSPPLIVSTHRISQGCNIT